MRRPVTCLSLGVILFGTLLWAGPALGQAREWTWYKNKAFDNAIEVPKDLFIKTSSTPDKWAELSAISKDGFELVINAKRDPAVTIEQSADRMTTKFGLPAGAFQKAKSGVSVGVQFTLYTYQGQFKGKNSWVVLMCGINGPNRYALLLNTPLDQYKANKDTMSRIANSIRPVAAAPK
jgi:hypothetical protein